MASIQLPRFIRLLPVARYCRLYPARQYRERRCFRHLCRLESKFPEQINQLQRYQTRGSFAYIGTTQKTYARFFWQQYSRTTTTAAHQPRRQHELELIVKDGQTQLTDNKGQKYYSDDPDSMIYQLTGMTIPMEKSASVDCRSAAVTRSPMPSAISIT